MKHDAPGLLAMANTGSPNTSNSQFYVTLNPTPHLDGRYTRFGQLVQGFELLPLIEEGDPILGVRIRGE